MPDPGRDEQALPGGERHAASPSRRSSPEPDSTYATSSVSWQTIAVTHPGVNTEYPSEELLPLSERIVEDHPAPAPAGQRDRIDVFQRDRPRPSPRLQHPFAVLQDPAAVVDDLHRGLEHDAVEVQRADVLAAGVGVVVVAQREVDGADATLLRRRPERRDLADAERELADHGRVLDALDAPRAAAAPPRRPRSRPPCRLSIVQVIGSVTWPGRPIPSITPSTTIVPSVSSSTAANATSAHSGSGPIIWPRFLIEVDLERRPVLDRDREVGAPWPEVTRTFSTPSSAAIASQARRWARSSSSTVSPHAAHARLDRRDLGVVRARLLDRRDVREAVGPLEVGDDDDLVRVDHRLVQVARRRHRE